MRTVSQRLTVTFCLLVAIAAASQASGSRSTVWGIDRDEMESRLALGDYEFLYHVDPRSVDLGELRYLGDDAPHQLGAIYESLELWSFAERLYRFSWESGSEPWARESLLALLEMLSSLQEYAEIEPLARAGGERYGNDETIMRYLLESLYWRRADADVVELSRDLTKRDAENALWVAVSAGRLRAPDWPDRYRELYRDYPAGEAHSRVWVYLRANPDTAARFAPDELEFFRAKQLQSEGRLAEALENYSALASLLVEAPTDDAPAGAALLLSPYGLLDFYRAGSTSGRQSATAAHLIALAERSDPEIERRAREYAGRLYRTAGAFTAAAGQLRASLELQSGDDAKRVGWYLLSSLVRQNPVQAVAELAVMAPRLDDPLYFADVFSELGGALAERERWDIFLLAYEAIRDFADLGTLASYELVLAEAVRTGALDLAESQRSRMRRAYLERAAGQSIDLYSAFLARTELGLAVEPVLLGAVGGSEENAAEPDEMTNNDAGNNAEVREEILVHSAMRYGRVDEAYALMRGAGRISSETLIALAEQLAARGRYRESIQTALRISLADPPDPGLATAGQEQGEVATPVLRILQLQYPRAYAPLVAEVLEEEDIRPELLFALVREESLFDPRIVSSAGAVGLTQLLPTTADDVARRMRITVTDLTDPLANLRVGARYVSMLEEQFGDLFKALAAYNAGQGHVRSWERRRPGQSGLLFHRAMPFAETYFHIKKVVVSAVYYGYLYENQSAEETLKRLFPALVSSAE